jgi:enediyne biosynthesis protein E4
MQKLYLFVFIILFTCCSKSTRFQLLSSKETGIDFKNTIVESDSFNVMTYEYIYNGAGVGIADLNNDGLPDIILVGNQVSPRVYLNLGNFKFRDITANFEGLTNDQWYSGVAIVDINNDGWPDVYLTSTGHRKTGNKLWVNLGVKDSSGPHFREMAKQYGIADTSQCVAAAFFDYDRDGNPDLYLLNNTVNSRMNTSYRPKVVDGSASNNDKLYHNNGDGTFTDVTKKAGILYEGFGLGLAIGDVNKDGYPDIYISNDFNSNDLLYINQGDGTFKNEISKYMSYQSKSSMGNDMADVNNDGNLDVITLDMLPEKYYRRKQTINGFSYIFYVLEDKFGYEHQYLRNMLHVHNGFLKGEMLPYSELGQMAGIYQTDWSWSALFADYNNDGRKDLIITSGFPRDMTDKDWTRYKTEAYPSFITKQQAIDKAPPIKVLNRAFENAGNLNFINRTKDWLPDIPGFSNGAAFVDLDNNGALDMVINNINGEALILRNNTMVGSKGNANFIRIKLTGKFGNTMALGAKVELWSKSDFQYTEHFLTRGYASSVDPVIHFGIGKDEIVDSIKVSWPASGYVSILKNVKANQTIEINEKNSGPVEKPVKNLGTGDLLFAISDSTINYMHEQKDFPDFFLNQKIIPHKFSQIGPVMAKGDLNGDGREDLIIGATNSLPTMVYLRSGNGFKRVSMEGLTTQKPFSESDIAIVDINNDGYKDVVAVAGGYENPNENDYRHYLYENHKGTFVRTPLPIPPFPASVVRPCDFNHDGYVDLFVGCRVKKGAYPYANRSWLIINDKGTLKADSSNSFDLGMVTDAIWTDYDHDGWEDLLVLREFNSPILLKNMGGKKLVPQNLPELEGHHGIWYSVIAGDFNHDGYEDYILGNLGDNHRFTVSDQYPLRLYAIDFDLDGNLDPVMTGYWKDPEGKMKEYPVNYLDELNAQSNYFHKKFKDFAAFSVATIDDIIDKNLLKRVEFKLFVNTTSSYILWNEKGKFRWEKLPEALQVAPINKMIVRDFNDDTYPDILVTGNDYTYDVSTGYYDANKGLVLLNKGSKAIKGKQSFDVLTPSQSGIALQGMVESLQCFDGDTMMIVAGINRSKTVVYKHIHKKNKAKDQKP